MVKCEIKATGKSGNYEVCENTGTRVGRFGWISCEDHSSVADLKLSDDSLKLEIVLRLSNRPDLKKIQSPALLRFDFPNGGNLIWKMDARCLYDVDGFAD